MLFVLPFKERSMTRKEIMANRLLDKEIVDEIREAYAGEHVPSNLSDYDDEELAEMRYISPEKVQRMSPEEVIYYLISIGHKAESAEDILRLLAIATGREEKELSDAIFGEGGFSPMQYYEPTPLQKKAIKIIAELRETASIPSAPEMWPKDLAKRWEEICDKVPEADTDFFKECGEYLRYYTKEGGMPYWLEAK